MTQIMGLLQLAPEIQGKILALADNYHGPQTLSTSKFLESVPWILIDRKAVGLLEEQG